ncbi:hypothetical protein Tco_0683014 [Tanacetum coccineum]|uniref:Uncharacterized protein n=1 Tax=Tanacetum coccineum TaxID=301880 RepID=A0ABQ4XST2_9ASTR
MAETMERYMSKTRADYGSGVARPKIEDKDNFKLKGQFLKELRASVSVMPLSTYLNLGLGELAHTKLTVELADRTVKYPKEIAKNVLDVWTRRMELDLEARLMGETLMLNRSLDPFFEDYIKLNDLNEPFDLRRNQGDDLMLTIEEGERFDFTHATFSIFYVNVMSKKFHNSINEREDFIENMDAYRDEGMGDVILGEPFLREVGIKTKRFKGIITIYNGNDEVTYQMDPITFKMRRRENGSHADTLACMRWNDEEKLKKILT